MTGPFGEMLATNSTKPINTVAGTSYTYVGQHQKLTEEGFGISGGIIQMGQRLYLPILGRFLSVDPIEGGTDNAYVYVTDPVNDFDLSGTIGFKKFFKDHWRGITQVAVTTVSVVAIGAVCAATAGVGCIVAGAAIGAAAGAASNTAGQINNGKKFNWKSFTGETALGGVLGGLGAGQVAGKIGGSLLGKSSANTVTKFGQKMFNSKFFGVDSKFFGRGGTYAKGILNRGPIRMGWGPYSKTTASFRTAIVKAGKLHIDWTKARW